MKWIAASLIVSTTDALAETFADDWLPVDAPVTLHSFLCYFIAPIACLILTPLWLLRLFLFALAERVSGTVIGDYGTGYSDSMTFLMRFFGDLFVCSLYILLWQAGRRLWPRKTRPASSQKEVSVPDRHLPGSCPTSPSRLEAQNLKVLSAVLIVAIVLSFGVGLNSILSLLGSITISFAIIYFTWRRPPQDEAASGKSY